MRARIAYHGLLITRERQGAVYHYLRSQAPSTPRAQWERYPRVNVDWLVASAGSLAAPHGKQPYDVMLFSQKLQDLYVGLAFFTRHTMTI